MSEPRKRRRRTSSSSPAIRVWPRDYYTQPPEVASAIETENYRLYFLNAIARVAPNVLHDLTAAVLPLYREMFWDVVEKGGGVRRTEDDYRRKYHRRMAKCWAAQATTNFWWQHKPELRELMLLWAQSYRINTEWVLHKALDACLYWTVRHNTFGSPVGLLDPKTQQEYILYLESGDDDAAVQNFRTEMQQLEAEACQPIRWPAQMQPISPSPSNPLKFECIAWAGFNVDRYRKYAIQEFTAFIDQHLSLVHEKIPRLREVKDFSHPELFERLADYLCNGRKREELASTPGAYKTTVGVHKDLHKVGDLIGMPMPRKGRPRKSPPKT